MQYGPPVVRTKVDAYKLHAYKAIVTRLEAYPVVSATNTTTLRRAKSSLGVEVRTCCGSGLPGGRQMQ